MSRLLSLKLSNFRSFFSEQTLPCKNKINSNITAIYGPNASGKSNTAKALLFIKWFITNSANAEITDIPSEPFVLIALNYLPISFSVEFQNDNRKFRYSFSFIDTEIISEKLIDLSSQKEKVIFNREHQTITNASTAKQFGFTESLLSKTRKTTLLITKAREDNNSYANEVFDFLYNLNIVTCGTSTLRQISIALLKKNPSMKQKVLDFLKEADFWIRGISIEDIYLPEGAFQNPYMIDEAKQRLKGKAIATVTTTHAVRNQDGTIIDSTQFSLSSQESKGTNVMFDLAALIIMTFEQNAILCIDEFGLHLHPDICQFLLTQFRKHSEAQLILNTHDILLMDSLKREEIVFVNKRQNEESILTPFMSLSPRENEPFSKRYQQGLYGAKPIIAKTELS